MKPLHQIKSLYSFPDMLLAQIWAIKRDGSEQIRLSTLVPWEFKEFDQSPIQRLLSNYGNTWRNWAWEDWLLAEWEQEGKPFVDVSNIEIGPFETATYDDYIEEDR